MKYYLYSYFFAALFNELVVYIFYSYQWPDINCDSRNCTKLLIVADPQILGQNRENFINRFDSDKFLRKTFAFAKRHVQPDSVLFLGDLMDEGHIATDKQFQYYYERFISVFGLEGNLDGMNVIVVAGDNDIGGEGDKVDIKKIDRLARLFNCTRSIIDVGSVRIIRVMNYYDVPAVPSNEEKRFQIAISHYPLIGWASQFSRKMINTGKKVDLILSAHDHGSYATLFSMENMSFQRKIDMSSPSEDEWSFRRDSGFLVQITVPTCSYRMGRWNYAYGVLIHDERKPNEYRYQLLWLPNRFLCLTLYVATILFLPTTCYLLHLYCVQHGFASRLDKYIKLCDQKTKSKIVLPAISKGIVSSSRPKRNSKCVTELATSLNRIIVFRLEYLRIVDKNGRHRELDTRKKSPWIFRRNHLSSDCRFNYLEFWESSFKNRSSLRLCGFANGLENFSFKTNFRDVKITFRGRYNDHFMLRFSTEFNGRHFLASVKNEMLSNNVMSSPFFPMEYPSNMVSQYVIRCETSNNNSCRIKLIFDDFLIGPTSVLEIFDFGMKRMAILTGRIFRPGILITSGTQMLIRFYGGKSTGLGFKAHYYVVEVNKCGGLVRDLGGAITMMNMIPEEATPLEKKYDCVWIVLPMIPPGQFKTSLFVRISSFKKMGNGSSVSFRNGITSSGELLDKLDWLEESGESYSVNLNSGLYLRLYGTFNARSHMQIAYAAHYDAHTSPDSQKKQCYSKDEFLCQNNRCIAASLQCDTIDHCGDSSDEAPFCYGEFQPSSEHHAWYSFVPNFWFRPMDNHSMVPFAYFSISGVLFLVMLFAMCVFCEKFRRATPQEMTGEMQSFLNFPMANEFENASANRIPFYEFPPNYEELYPPDATNSQDDVFASENHADEAALKNYVGEHSGDSVPSLDGSVDGHTPAQEDTYENSPSSDGYTIPQTHPIDKLYLMGDSYFSPN